MPLELINNEESGLEVRTKMNLAITAINDGVVSGPTGFQGYQGATGPQGYQGATGFGPQGSIGATGFQGYQGATGPQGYQGSTGTFDNDTLMYQSGQVNGTSFTGNPQTLTVPFVGTFTSSYNILIESEDQRNWTITNKTPNNFTINSNDSLSITSVVNWSALETGSKEIGAFVGATGPQGVQGFQGDQGDVGPQGATGPQGFQGDQGFQGVQGFQGDQGDIGPQGTQGPDGVFSAGLLMYQSGQVNGLSFSGDPAVYTTSFIGIFTASYNVIIESDEQRFWTITNKTPNGFDINSNTSSIPTNPVNWTAIETGNTFVGAFIGSQGPIGPQGEIGPTGPQGDIGPTGPQGEIGPTGPQGDIGPRGATGPRPEVYKYNVSPMSSTSSNILTVDDLTFYVLEGGLYSYKYTVYWSCSGGVPNIRFGVWSESSGTMSGMFSGSDSTGNLIGTFPFHLSNAYLGGTQSLYTYTITSPPIPLPSKIEGFIIIEGICNPDSDSDLNFVFSNQDINNSSTVVIEPNSIGVLKLIKE